MVDNELGKEKYEKMLSFKNDTLAQFDKDKMNKTIIDQRLAKIEYDMKELGTPLQNLLSTF